MLSAVKENSLRDFKMEKDNRLELRSCIESEWTYSKFISNEQIRFNK
jgi:hypothetical protein